MQASVCVGPKSTAKYQIDYANPASPRRLESTFFIGPVPCRFDRAEAPGRVRSESSDLLEETDDDAGSSQPPDESSSRKRKSPASASAAMRQQNRPRLVGESPSRVRSESTEPNTSSILPRPAQPTAAAADGAWRAIRLHGQQVGTVRATISRNPPDRTGESGGRTKVLEGARFKKKLTSSCSGRLRNVRQSMENEGKFKQDPTNEELWILNQDHMFDSANLAAGAIYGSPQIWKKKWMCDEGCGYTIESGCICRSN